MKKIKFLLLILPVIACAQIEKKELSDCIEKGVKDFFVDIGRIDDSNNKSNVGIIEVLSNKVLGYNKVGVYRIIDYSTHKTNFLMLKKEDNYKILPLVDIKNDILEITIFLSNNFSEEKELEYLKTILSEIEKNLSLKRSDDIIPKAQRWLVCGSSDSKD